MLQILRPISPIAWIPVAIILLGVGDHAATSLIFLGALFPIIVACVDGVSNVPSVFRLRRPQLRSRACPHAYPGRLSRPRCRKSSSACASPSASPGWSSLPRR